MPNRELAEIFGALESAQTGLANVDCTSMWQLLFNVMKSRAYLHEHVNKSETLFEYFKLGRKINEQ